MLTAALIKRFAPSARADIVQGLVDGWPAIYAAGITKPNRLQHFMAELAVESAGLTNLEENLNYSAQRLCAVWPSRFPSISAATSYAHSPQKLADKVYGGRLGNVKIGDGWLFRGSGLLQVTGRENFRNAGFEVNPDDLRHMPGALTAALSFWTKHGLNKLVDAGDLVAERKAVNGGTIGIDDLRTYLKHAATIFVEIVPPGAPVVVEAVAKPPAPSPMPVDPPIDNRATGTRSPPPAQAPVRMYEPPPAPLSAAWWASLFKRAA